MPIIDACCIMHKKVPLFFYCEEELLDAHTLQDTSVISVNVNAMLHTLYAAIFRMCHFFVLLDPLINCDSLSAAPNSASRGVRPACFRG
jgi:hypothetical protein